MKRKKWPAFADYPIRRNQTAEGYQRNAEIYKRYLKGAPLEVLSSDYGISPARVKAILLRIRKALEARKIESSTLAAIDSR